MNFNVNIGLLIKLKHYQGNTYAIPIDFTVAHVNKRNEAYIGDKKYRLLNATNYRYTDVGFAMPNQELIFDVLKKREGKEIDEVLNKLFQEYIGIYFSVKPKDNYKVSFINVEEQEEVKLCDQLFFDEKDMNNKTEKEEIEKSNKEIYEELINTIIGQDQVVRGVFAHLLANKKIISYNLPNDETRKMINNIFINGPTGSGKTFIVEEIAKRLDIPVKIVDANDYTMAGFVGQDINNIILDLVERCNGDIEQAQKAIIYIDEIDKIASTDSHDRVTTTGVQAGLLKMMEGKEIKIETKELGTKKAMFFDTSKLTFICSGACSGIEDITKKRTNPSSIGFGIELNKEIENNNQHTTKDLVKYGFMPEFIGRFSRIYQTNQLSKEMLKTILTSSLKSPYLYQKRKFELLGSTFELTNEELDRVVDKAYDMNTGARGLNNIVNEICEDFLATVVIDENQISEDDNKKKVITLN